MGEVKGVPAAGVFTRIGKAPAEIGHPLTSVARELPPRPEPLDVGRHDRLDRMQARYAEALQRTALLLCGRTHDVVLPEQADLVERHGANGVRQRPSEGCDEARQPEWE